MENSFDIPKEIEAVLILHLGKNYADYDTQSQVEFLEKKKKRYRIMLAVNVFALLFFTYSFVGGITQLSNVVYYVLGTVFVLNVLLIFHQRKQLNVAIEYLRKQVI